jgi:hypothetical protein
VIDADQTIRLRPLSVVEEGDEVLVGDPDTGTFVTLPPVGGVVISALQRGATVEESAREAEEFAGEPVDVVAFTQILRELGFVADPDTADRDVARTAPIQARRWLRGVRPELARPLFGHVAWVVYSACAVVNAGLLIAQPSLLPDSARDPFVVDSNIGLSALLLIPIVWAERAMHECWHWLAARAIGVKARFGIDHRMMMLVFETDLSQLWTVPRRQRFGPMLAGLAFDSVLLSLVLGGEACVAAHRWSPPEAVADIMALLAYTLIAGMLWQSMIFLRTDLYAVLINALGCRDLWRVKSLMLRRAFHRLSPEQALELSSASDADLRTGRWFRWVWVGGVAGVLAWFGWLIVPMLAAVLGWMYDGLGRGPVHAAFWYAILCGVPALSPWLLASYLATKNTMTRLVTARHRIPPQPG